MIHYKDTNLNFLDIETTGSNYHRDKITEVYISKVRNAEVIDQFHSLINPEVTIDPFITKLTGINSKTVENAPLFEDIAEDIFDFINEEIIVAHNARFDYSFLKHNLERYGLLINLNYCCTVKLSRILYPRFTRHNLDSIIERIGFSSDVLEDNTFVADSNSAEEQTGLFQSKTTRHRASYDTDAIRVFFYHALAEHGEEKFLKAFNTAIKSSAIPSALLKIKMEDIPEAPGVYFFYGEEELPIYIGMSKNLRQRVYQHFYGDLNYIKDFNINQQLKRIEFVETAGTLGALIREALLVKKYQPTYNHMLRRNREVIKLEKFYDQNGYVNLKFKAENGIDVSNLDNLVGVFRSKMDLTSRLNDLVKEKGLCPRLLGLEKGKGACFPYQLGQCKGACIGKISAEDYNKIFDEAMTKIQIQSWPYDSQKTITEKSKNLEETFTFDKWCFVNSSIDDPIFKECEEHKFDMDIYKILARELEKLNLD